MNLLLGCFFGTMLFLFGFMVGILLAINNLDKIDKKWGG